MRKLPKKSSEHLRPKSALMNLRVSGELNEAVKAWAERHNLRYSEAVRALLEAGLKDSR